MKRSSLLTLTLFLAAFTLGARSAPAVEPTKLVPQDAALYVEVSDPSRIVQRLFAPDIVGMLDSVPQFRQFMQSDNMAQFRAAVAYIETRLGTDWRKAVGDLTGGGAVLAVCPGKPEYVLAVVRAKDADLLQRTVQLLIELTEKDAKEKGRESPVKSRDYKGVKAWAVGKDVFYAIVADVLVISNKQEGLKTALEMNAGEGPASITELDLWKEARSRLPGDSVGWAFGRLDLLRQAGIAKELYSEKAPDPGIPLVLGGISHVARQAAYVTAALTLSDERLGLRLEVPRDGKPWPEAFQGFYATEAGAEAAVPLRPARTLASLSFYRDFKAVWDTREQLVAAEALPKLTELETNVGGVLFGGRDFAGEVLGELGPHVRLVATAQDFSRMKVVPQIKLPAFALVLELKHPEDFGADLVIAYQSVMGLANIGLGQQNQPRFMLSSEMHHGFEIRGARFMDRAAAKVAEKGSAEKGSEASPRAKTDEAGHLRYNFSPACSIAGRYFVLGSTIEIVKEVIDALGDPSAPPKTTPHNVVFELNTAAIIDILRQNKEPLISQNMLEGGNTRQQAEQELDILLRVLGLFGNGQWTWTAEPSSLHADLSIEFKGAGK